MVSVLQTAKHIYNVHAFRDDSDWADHETQALREIGVSKEGLREFAEDIAERAGAG